MRRRTFLRTVAGLADKLTVRVGSRGCAVFRLVAAKTTEPLSGNRTNRMSAYRLKSLLLIPVTAALAVT